MEKLRLKQKILLTIIGILTFGGISVFMHWLLRDEVMSEEIIWSTIIQAVLLGILFGFGFPYLMKRFAPKMLRKVRTPELQESESVIMDGGANLFRNRWIAVGGKLFLTNKRLIFNSHKYNFQNGETFIPLESIIKIEPRKTAGIVNNGLRIETAEKEKFDFVVNNREQWMEILTKRNSEILR